jgi:3-oxoacyl-[acyl-carrier protein] reductase
MTEILKKNPSILVVTGASRGIGFAVANYFLQKGFLVAGCSRGSPTIDHENYRHYLVDVCNESAVRGWARNIKRDLSRVDVLVCNVGLVRIGAVTGSTSLDSFKSFLDSILGSTFLVCREFSKMMMLQRYGRIINIGSIMSEIHAPGTCAYASAKSAVNEFTKVLAREVAEYGVTCNVVSPSMVRTNSNAVFGDRWEKAMLEMQTIKRPIDASELCPLIEFFASPLSSIITGQVLHTCFVN